MTYYVKRLISFNKEKEAVREVKSLKETFPDSYVFHKQIKNCDIYGIILKDFHEKMAADNFASRWYRKYSCVVDTKI